jgi:hypothetical protein
MIIAWAFLLGAVVVAGSSNADEPAPSRVSPRKVDLPPAGDAGHNPIDRILAGYFAQHGLAAPAVVDDRTFARRAFLDTIGLLPPAGELDAFVADPRSVKREELVHSLLARNRVYAEHWLSFWNDLLRNDYRGTGYIDGGRKQITGWLYQSLAQNKPYDQFVRELLSPPEGAEGFLKGIVWRGVVNASQVPEMQAAQNVSQVFMGVNLKCASCHDSFINEWKLADAYGLAGVFADGKLEMHHCDKPIGTHAPLKFIYPELGDIPADLPRPRRLTRLANLVTGPENGQFARTIVNRLWARLFGRGLIEPVDDMSQPAWHADLLDYLAGDLVDHRYDLKHTLATILSSGAYQRPSVGAVERAEKVLVFRGPAVRRMTAEQWTDAVASLTGVWPAGPAETIDWGPGGSAAMLEAAGDPGCGGTRSCLTTADPLMTSLGRPNREQVVTERASAATTLQALALTNGSIVADRLRKGAQRLVARDPGWGRAATDRLFREGLGRPATPDEAALAADLVGSPATQEGVEDLLWVVIMLPEFQLIH